MLHLPLQQRQSVSNSGLGQNCKNRLILATAITVTIWISPEHRGDVCMIALSNLLLQLSELFTHLSVESD